MFFSYFLWCSSETVEAFGKDPKQLGAQMGMVSLLLT
jgi:hypothetical protein